MADSKPKKSKPGFLTIAVHISKMIQVTDYTISTWLLLGASLQCLLLIILPKTLALIPPFALLFYRIFIGYLRSTGHIHNPLMDGVMDGMTTAQYPAADGTLTAPRSGESITVLVLSASFAHPNGRFSPGSKEIGAYFSKMWKDAEAQRTRYGYLGNTPAMAAEPDELEDYGSGNGHMKGKTLMWLSYWKTLDGLHDFSHAEAHMKGWNWWYAGAGKKYKHIGIMHEVYEVPAGNWENIFYNFRPFGICKVHRPGEKDHC